MAITPRRRSSSDRLASLFAAPRSLKAPIGCMFSYLMKIVAPVSSERRGEARKGVRSTCGPMVSAARLMSSMSIAYPPTPVLLASRPSHLARRQVLHAEEPARPEDQDRDEDGVERDVTHVDGHQRRPQGLEQPHRQPAEEGALDRADAAEHRGHERLQPELEAAGEAEPAILQHHEGAGEPGGRSAQGEGL